MSDDAPKSAYELAMARLRKKDADAGEAEVPLKEFRKTVEAAMELTKIPRDFSSRYLNDGFSGGEKKRLEMLQLALLQPHTAILDETDSGLDIDALNIVAEAVNTVAKDQGMGVLIITHYQRILHLVQPERVSILYDGRIVRTLEGDGITEHAIVASSLNLAPEARP